MSTESAAIDWAARAAQAQRAVLARHLRRLVGWPGTRLGVVSWPSAPTDRLFLHWHLWWQAHLLDCLIDAQERSPSAELEQQITELARSIRTRNFGRWTNDYYDDMAWLALALHRAGALVGRSGAAGVTTIVGQILSAWDPDFGGIPWRRGDLYHNTPANGPAAILLARTGNLARARETADWIHSHLLLPNGLIADGLRTNGFLDTTIYTYCQGVVLGAELELSRSIPAGGDHSRIHALVDAVDRELTNNGVFIGHGGGDPGLFAGILARYLTLVATELAGDTAEDHRCRATAARLVLAAAEAAWTHAATTHWTAADGTAGTVADGTVADGTDADGTDADGTDAGGPLFGPDWSAPAVIPSRGRTVEPERDLSVQLSGWMVIEAAARVARTLPA